MSLSSMRLTFRHIRTVVRTRRGELNLDVQQLSMLCTKIPYQWFAVVGS